MAKAYKCDITGEMVAGEPKYKADLELSKNVKAEVRLFVQTEPGQFENAALSPKAEALIREALVAVLRKSLSIPADKTEAGK